MKWEENYKGRYLCFYSMGFGVSGLNIHIGMCREVLATLECQMLNSFRRIYKGSLGKTFNLLIVLAQIKMKDPSNNSELLIAILLALQFVAKEVHLQEVICSEKYTDKDEWSIGTKNDNKDIDPMGDEWF